MPSFICPYSLFFFTDRDLVNAILKGFAFICINEIILTMLIPIQVNDWALHWTMFVHTHDANEYRDMQQCKI